MISQQMEKRLNDHLNVEFAGAYAYLQMAGYCRSTRLNGCGYWFEVQAKEELAHAMKFYTYLGEQGAKVTLKAIPEPKTQFSSVAQVFEESLAQERKVTALIHSLVDAAKTEKDHATEIFLQWFVTEQVEEEGSVMEILDKFKLLKGNSEGLYFLDRELASRE